MYAFMDRHRQQNGGEPICRLLQIAPSAYRRHAARQHDAAPLSGRAQREQELMPHFERVWQANLRVYGADKVWRQLQREGHGGALRSVTGHVTLTPSAPHLNSSVITSDAGMGGMVGEAGVGGPATGADNSMN